MNGFEKQPPLKVHIRWMIRRDMAEVLDIENRSFEYPWTEEDFIRALRQRNCIGMVAERGEKVVAFFLYELYKRRLRIINFAVEYELRRRGIGSQCIEKLTNKLSSQNRTHIDLEVSETNLDGQLFFKALGFRAIEVLPDHYEDRNEDAYLMRYRHEAGVEA